MAPGKPAGLVESLARRQCIVYLGSGVSASAQSQTGQRPPTWKAFLESGAKRLSASDVLAGELVSKLTSAGDYLMACEVLRRYMDDAWVPFLRENFVSPKYRAGELHKHILQLDARITLTPNFDSIYDAFVVSETQGTTKVKKYYDSDLLLALKDAGRAIFKVHGEIDEPSKMVFTKSDYARMRVRHDPFLRIVEALFLANSILFIGAGLNDPDVQLILENIRLNHEDAPPVYMTSPEGEVSSLMDGIIRSGMNIKLIRYSPEDGHAELRQWVAALVEDVSAKRDEIATQQNW